jgi:predicted SAM-dependent methyltransferase
MTELEKLGRKSVSLLKDYFKPRTTYNFRRALHDLVEEGRLSYVHWSATRKLPRYLQDLPLRLNLGCGPHHKEGWLNVDLYNPAADLHLDLRRRWPFPDNSVAHIYSEHAFEHFEFSEEVPHFLAESLRVLRDDGIFDVGVPDTAWALSAYGNPEHIYWPMTPQWHPESCETQLDHINYHFRQGEEHKYAWDEETLARSLRRAGFVHVARREHDPSLDTPSWKMGTLYMRASKSNLVAS